MQVRGAKIVKGWQISNEKKLFYYLLTDRAPEKARKIHFGTF